jgi:hypothetical protein
LLPCRCAAQLTFPAAVEVDLIFPRNDTYSPTAHMPIVFAIQNSRYAAPLDLSFQYTIYRGADLDDEIGFGAMILKYADFSSSDPYFALDSVPYMNTTEGIWSIMWTVYAANCSHAVIGDPPGVGQTNVGGGISASHLPYNSGPTQFTTKNGAQQPDLVAATADDTCASSGNFTFDVTGTLKVADPPLFNGRSSCAVLPTPLSKPPANPCGAKLNSSAASSISAAITSCAVHQPTVTTGCVPLTTSDGFRGRVSFGGMVFLMATSVWFMYFV